MLQQMLVLVFGGIWMIMFRIYKVKFYYRLNPHNVHQWPTVVSLCGSHRQGAIAVNCARQLASHGVKTVVFLLDPTHLTTQLSHELALFRHTNNKLITTVQGTMTKNCHKLLNLCLISHVILCYDSCCWQHVLFCDVCLSAQGCLNALFHQKHGGMTDFVQWHASTYHKERRELSTLPFLYKENLCIERVNYLWITWLDHLSQLIL